MTDVIFVDTNDLIYRMNAGLGSWQAGQPVPSDAFRFLDDLIQGDSRIVTNTKIIEELLNGGYADGQMIVEWLDENQARVEIDHLSPEVANSYTGGDKGERSLVFETAQKPQFQTNSGRQIFLSGEPFSNKSWFHDAGYGPDNYRNALGLYADDLSKNFSEQTYLRGMDYIDSMRIKYPNNENIIFGKSIGSNRSLVDFWRSLSFDERGSITLPEMGSVNWSDLSSNFKANIYRAAGEGLGAALVGLDSAFTYQSVIDALSQGDLRKADELLGGLLGRTFGGAFLGAIAGAELGSPFGPAGIIIASIVGSIIGAFGGELIGEWLFGKAADFGFDAVDALDALGDLLRHFRSDPLILDLDGNGITLAALSGSNTRFDIDGDGAAERVGWAGPNDGLLVLDANLNGMVDGVDELIGNTHVDGFDELASLDINADGKIDQQDADFSKLVIWRDANGDGVSASSELLTTAQAGITGFNLSYVASGIDVGGSIIARVGSYTLTAGGQRAMASVQFATDETVTRLTLPENVDLGNIATLPNLGGYGPIADLRTSMFHDATLEAMVLDLASGPHNFDTFEDFLKDGFLDVLYRWAGVDLNAAGETDATLREKLIEALTGESLFDLSAGQQDRIDDVWDSIIGRFGVGFLVQAANRQQNLQMLDLGDQLSALDYDDPDYFDTVADLTEAALSIFENLQLPYTYLKKFSALSMDPDTGMVTGDFDAFAREFISDQPSFAIMNAASSSGSSPPPPPSSSVSTGYVGGSIEAEAPEPTYYNEWFRWYHEQGSLLFNVAAAMGIGSEYVSNVTGWQWFMKLQANVYGTSGIDNINEIQSIGEHLTTSIGVDGGKTVTPWTGLTRDQRIYGLAGNDELRGNDGIDTMIGGVGNDLLLGGSASDMYVYSEGDGLDRITEGSGEDDAIFFSTELKLDDLQVFRLSGTNDLQLHFGDSSQGIILTNQVNMGGSAVERFSFVGVGPIDAGDIATIYLRSFSSIYNDIITGTAAGEEIRGLGGNDVLSGLNGDDKIWGDEGNDILSGGNGDDRIEGGAGNDTISGNAGADIMQGGIGNDLMSGHDGDDTFVFNVGDGQDVISDVGQGNDTIQLGAGILPGDVTVSQGDVGNDLVLTFAGSTDRITISDTMLTNGYRIERVTFADGTVWTHADLVARSVLANAGDDAFYGGYDNDILIGGAGNDMLLARGGNDVLSGGVGNDLLSGHDGDDTFVFNAGDGQDVISDDGNGNDTVQLGAGILPSDVVVFQADAGKDLVLTFIGSEDRIVLNDTITVGTRRIERVMFSDGTIWTHADLLARVVANNVGDDVISGTVNADNLSGGNGNDIISGGSGSDILIGGTGNDTLSGNDHGDTYVFNIGDGQDIINDNGQAGDDIVQLGAGIAPVDVTVSQADNGNDLVLTFAGSADRITLDNTVTGARIEKVTFADGTVWTFADMMARSMLGNGGDNTFYGSADAEALTGGAGNDVLLGRSGSDILIGGTGNDTLSGNDHGDTYVFNIGDGQDIINDNGQAGDDIVQLGAGIAPVDVTVSQADNGNDLVLTFAGSADRITLDNTVTGARIEKVTFADGTVWTFADMMARSQQPTEGADILYGYEGVDNIAGGSGDDQLYGGNGNDTLSGNGGNDIISGGSGTDIAKFAGEQASYSLVTSGGSVSIIDTSPLVDGDDGKDTLIGIEKTEFKGGVQVGITSPIVLDLNGNGVSLLDNRNTKVSFDWDGDGKRDQTGWIGRDDGFLFIDRDGNGTVSNGGELSFTSDKEGAKSDLDGLRAFDSNGDGIFSLADDQFEQFKVWRDRNGNGRVDANEILFLQEAGVASIDLAGEAVNQSWEWGENVTVNTGSFTRADGTVGSFSDVALNYDVAPPGVLPLGQRISSPGDRHAPLTSLKQAAQLTQAIASFGIENRVDELLVRDEWGDRRQNIFAVGKAAMR